MTEIAFTGDIAFSKYFKDAWSSSELIDSELIEFLSSADYTVPNVEGALTAGDMKRGDSSTPAHASDPRAVLWLLKMNGNIWNLSNNHTLDCDEKGLEDTINLAKEHDCRILVAGKNIDEAAKPESIESSGGIGLLSVCYKQLFEADANKPGIVFWDDFSRIEKQIREVKKKNRWCVLIVHGGEEFSNMPLPTVRKKYLRYLRYGADIVVGHHPHVPQHYEKVGNKMIYYSLGNLIFDTDYQRLQRHTDEGVLLKLKFTDDNFEHSCMGYRINREKQCIEKANCPTIFRSITAKEYKRLIPLAMKCFLDEYKEAKIFLRPYMKEYSKFQWAKWYWENKGFGVWFSLMVCRVRYMFKGWKKSNPELIHYISK